MVKPRVDRTSITPNGITISGTENIIAQIASLFYLINMDFCPNHITKYKYQSQKCTMYTKNSSLSVLSKTVLNTRNTIVVNSLLTEHLILEGYIKWPKMVVPFRKGCSYMGTQWIIIVESP